MRLLRVIIGLTVTVLVFAAGWWAADTAVSPPDDPFEEPGSELFTVPVETVGRSLSFVAVAEWPLESATRVSGPGTVTSVTIELGEVVSPGDTLFTIDLRPVTVAKGPIPSFRDLSLRSEGMDVSQLQAPLAELGYFNHDVDGYFGTATRAAVRDWQDHLGVDRDGIVRAGDLVYVSSLPAQMVVGDEISVGNQLSGGETAIKEVTGSPKFVIPLASEQRSRVPLSGNVLVFYPGGTWNAVIASVIERPEAREIQLLLTSPGGDQVCGNDCRTHVPLEEAAIFRVEIVVVPETTGPAVPIAAISTDPGVSTYVTGEDGERIEVEIIEASDGIAIVDGLAAGTVILLPVPGR